jgi:hypothetical protein
VIHFHKWNRWRVNEYYWDISYGQKVVSTEMIRDCEKCGRVQTKDYYGTRIPKIEGEQ